MLRKEVTVLKAVPTVISEGDLADVIVGNMLRVEWNEPTRQIAINADALRCN